jgi:hypothetical protein
MLNAGVSLLQKWHPDTPVCTVNIIRRVRRLDAWLR